MKIRLIVVTLALCLVASVAEAQKVTGFVEYEGITSTTTFFTSNSQTLFTGQRDESKVSKLAPQVNLYVKGPLKGKIGWTVWTITANSYGEALPGLTFAPTDWMEVSSSFGLENSGGTWARGASSLWVGKGRFSYVMFQEYGPGSGRWQKQVGTVGLNKTISAGVLQQSFVGMGPYLEAKMGRVTLWGSYTFDKVDYVSNHLVFGGRFGF